MHNERTIVGKGTELGGKSNRLTKNILKKGFILTMDVTALYSNISHELGIKCIDHTVSQDPEIPEAQKFFLLNSFNFILENNYFIYGEEIYRQKKGTAMETRVAPTYANLFMGSFEEKYIYGDEDFKSKIILCKRFIDDLIFIWKGDQEEAMSFVGKNQQK